MTDLLASDLTVGVPEAAAPETAPAAAPAPAAAGPVTLSAEQFQALLDAARAPRGGPPPAPPIPEKPPSTTSLFTKGALVRHTWFDVYSGRNRTRHGVVVELVPADPSKDGSFARSVVAWFEGVSGPIGDHELEAG
jgi:hypothetical protein